MSSEEVKKESTKSDSDEEAHVTGSMVKSFKEKKLNKFDFVNENGRHIHLSEEQINNQKKLKEEAKAKAAKQEREKVYKVEKRLLYAKRNKAISLGKGASKVSKEVHSLFLKGMYLRKPSQLRCSPLEHCHEGSDDGFQYVWYESGERNFWMDNPNIIMEEYIMLEEEKALRHGKVYNWKIAKYGKICYDEDIYDLISIKIEFPAIVFNDELSSKKTLSCEPTISSLNNNEIDFRISFDESDDKDYTVIFDKKSLSYKIIFVNDLKLDYENDNDKVNMPSFRSPEPTVNYLDDLDYFKDFEKKFPTIVYNDNLTSKLDFLTEPTISPQHIDKFNMKDETLLSECDEEEQNVLYFNNLFSFNIIYLDDLKSDKGNDNDKIDIK
uniref:Uncharacterized protein n=1 Tax=Tanacetum cinerariifolium TaxID=118510 RepID=A0A6L2NZQ2_TANCI|nr:hypothetical protein [Tanacetum cinerariifolium]